MYFWFKINTMAIKVKEMKDDAIVDIKVNKNFYFMMKNVSMYLFKHIKTDDKETYLKELTTKKYEELDDLQRSFYTIALFLAEVEKQSISNELYEEKEILQPGDEGYVAPKLD